jgi:phage baseplate assembly protein W
MPPESTAFGFPFAVDAAGFVSASGGDEAIRGKIIQVLFTSPGERVNLPQFGCGLFDLVFEPSDDILAGAMRFTVGRALMRWLADEIIVDGVDVRPGDETVTVEVVYTKKLDLQRQAVRIQFR